jgi:hypothetical protein
LDGGEVGVGVAAVDRSSLMVDVVNRETNQLVDMFPDLGFGREGCQLIRIKSLLEGWWKNVDEVLIVLIVEMGPMLVRMLDKRSHHFRSWLRHCIIDGNVS